RQGQHIAPMAVGMKQHREAGRAWCCERRFELREPSLGNRRDVVCSRQHWRSPGWLGREPWFARKLAYPPEALKLMNNSKAHRRNDALRLFHKVPYLRRAGKGLPPFHHFSEHEKCYGRIPIWSSEPSIRSRLHQHTSSD